MRRLLLAAAIFCLFSTTPAFADGGAHVIDGSGVETPGSCHLETWVTLTSGDGGLINSAPACTRKVWPNLELGGFVAHGWTRDSGDTLVGLSPKLELRSETRGIGIGIATSIGYGVDQGRFETASIIVPVTIPVSDRLRFNLNAGWQWTRANQRHDLFMGAQADIALAKNLSLMVEGFTRAQDKAGGQAGLRWTVAGGAVDLDLLGGRYVDGATPNAITLGVTIRR